MAKVTAMAVTPIVTVRTTVRPGGTSPHRATTPEVIASEIATATTWWAPASSTA